MAEAPTFLFVLQPEFPINAAILATEALRIANQNSGRPLFRWRLASESGQPVRASNGMWMPVDLALDALPRADVLVLIEGNLPVQRNAPRLLAALRAAARAGTTVVAVDTATFAVAQAGLAGGRAVVLHWEAVPAFRERYPEIATAGQIYRLDGDFGFAAGGVATLDLMLALIRRFHGRALADEVANALVHTPRPAETAQRLDDPDERRRRTLSPRLVALMEQNLDFPLAPPALAAALGVSVRTLERHCRRRFGQSPTRLYLRVRLQAARNLLFYEEMSIRDVALACGFSYPSVFSRAFRDQFGQSPRAFRTAFRAEQAQSLRPEIHRLTAGAPPPR